jgi:hypothetical protein
MMGFLFRRQAANDVDVGPVLRVLAEHGGELVESDPLAYCYLSELETAERQGLVSSGSGWSAAYSLTPKGRRFLNAVR